MKQYFGVILLFALTACNSTENKTAEKKDSVIKDQAKVETATVSFKDENVAEIYTDYISLKDALVTAKFDDAKSAAKKLTVALNGHAGCENTALISTKIENAKDIAAQRKEFTHLSADVIALFKHASLNKGTIYVQHCPMANNGDGGDWLASEKKIQNPYYGSEMMECGAVLEEIKAN